MELNRGRAVGAVFGNVKWSNMEGYSGILDCEGSLKLAKNRGKAADQRQRRTYPTDLKHWSTLVAKPVLTRLARKLRKRGMSDSAIAVELGIERRTVAHYLSRRKAWPCRRARACVKSEDSAGCGDEIMPQSSDIKDLPDS